MIVIVAVIVVVSATAAGVAVAAPGDAPAESPAEQEERLVREGIDLRKAGDDLAAWQRFKRAYDLTHSPRTAAQLGAAEQALGRWEDADVHVTEALRSKGDTWIDKHRPTLEQSSDTIKLHLARIEVIGDPKGAELFVNGRPAGQVPLAEPVRVSAGEIDVELRAPGYVTGSRRLTLVGGQYQYLSISLEKVTKTDEKPDEKTTEKKTGPEKKETTVVDEHRERPARAPVSARAIARWSALGLAVAGLGTGIAASVIHEGKVSDFKSARGGACRDDGGRAVDESRAPAPDCQPFLDAAHTARVWQVVGFVGAGVFTGAWLALTLIQPGKPAEPSTATTSWTCTPRLDGRGVACALRFWIDRPSALSSPVVEPGARPPRAR